MQRQATSTSWDRHQRSPSVSQRTKWVVRDKAKFSLLVSEIKAFNDGLYSILNPETRKRAQNFLQAEIESSDEMESLQILHRVADVDDHISVCVSRRINALRGSSETSPPSSFFAVDMRSQKQFKDHFWGAGDQGVDVISEQTELKTKTVETLQTFWDRR
jgi:hypothetical protein